MIHYELNGNSFTLGDTVSGTCQWSPSDDEKRKTAKLTIGWRTEGRGDVNRESIYEIEILPNELTNFSCEIPLNVHPSYDGELLRIIWEVRVDVISKGLIDLLFTKGHHEAQIFRVTPQ
jgi:hypothetical protein